MKGSRSLAVQFIIQATIMLTIILAIAAFFLTQQTLGQLKTSSLREQKIFESAQNDKGELISNLLSRITPEAVMGLDLYSLQSYAEELLKDQDFAFVEIYDSNNKLLVKKNRNENETNLTVFEKEIHTDKAKLGIDKKVGSIKIALSRDKLDKIIKENKRAKAYATIRMLIEFIILAILIDILIASLLLLVLRKVVLLPLNKIGQNLENIAEGEGDLTQRLNFSSENELGYVAHKFDAFVSKLHSMIAKIVNNSHSLTTAAMQLSETSGAIADKANVVRNQSMDVTTRTENAKVTMENISTNVSNMSNSVQSIASAIEEMSMTLSNVTKNCQRESTIASDANSKAEGMREMMNTLSTAAQEITSVIDIITVISGQTNLLALNATIEAANAGQAGKGFAVVANEVKALAQKSAIAAKEISNKIKAMQTVTESSIREIKNITNSIHEINEISHTIVLSVEDQSLTVKNLASNVGNANNAAHEIAENVKTATVNLVQVSDSMQNVDIKVHESAQGMEVIQQQSVQLNKLAEELNFIVKQFKL